VTAAVVLWARRQRHESSASSGACSAGFLAARRASPTSASSLSLERAYEQEGPTPRQGSVSAGSRQASAPGTCQSGASARAPTAASADLPPRPRRDSAQQVVESVFGPLLALRLPCVRLPLPRKRFLTMHRAPCQPKQEPIRVPPPPSYGRRAGSSSSRQSPSPSAAKIDDFSPRGKQYYEFPLTSSTKWTLMGGFRP
jgi:hypothetical protein